MSQKFKIVLLGEGRVGKTSIIVRFTRDEFHDREVSTIQAVHSDKKIMVRIAIFHTTIYGIKF